MRMRSLHTRIVVSFTLLLLAVQSAGLVIINTIISKSARGEVDEQLDAGERVFSALREQNSRQLAQAAAVLSSDFAFREAIATHDRSTVHWALVNHGARINASLVMLADLSNQTVADTLEPERVGKAFPFPELISLASQKGQATSIVLVSGRAYELVVVPVLAPVPVAWLVTGFLVDDQLAKRLKRLTGLEVSFLDEERGDQWRVLATTMPAKERGPLLRALSSVQPGNSGRTTLAVGDEQYVTYVSQLGAQGDNAVVVLLQRSLRQALGPLDQLQRVLLILGGISLLATVLASLLMARSITKPVSILSAFARRIERGDYSLPLELHRQDEIGGLAIAINNMREGIAARQAQIMDLAYQDSLTGLPNRVLFNDRVQQALKAATRNNLSFGVLIMDLDRFKDVNDALGHHIGDLLLQEVSKRLDGTVLRESDTVARLGGDEFAVLLPMSDIKGAERVAQKLLDVLEQPILLEGHQLVVGASIGIAGYPEHGQDVSTLLRHADMAMYAAKRDRKGFVVYDDEYDESGRRHLSLMAELRQAVVNSELVLYYQPKIDLRTRTMSHVEALVRWIHPQRGFIAPDQFIPFAEQTGYITAITRWVIDNALHQCATWHARGLLINVSVNISARDLVDPELPELFSRLIEMHAASPEWLSLEITESAIMSDPNHGQRVLQTLRDMGLRLSIDDFGTGYSSLAYLKKLPAEELKIDRSFVMNMPEDNDDATIVRSTIELGHTMGLKVVAEGVENEATWNLLSAWGCDFAQGYYVSRPLPAERMEQWIADSGWGVAHKNPPKRQTELPKLVALGTGVDRQPS